jgi:hypothetical protein
MKENPTDANKVFKFVAGVLNGVTSIERHWSILVEVCKLTNQDFDAVSHFSFDLACDALACSIEQGKVPQQGMQVLKSLIESSQAAQVSSRLCSAVGVKQAWMVCAGEDSAVTKDDNDVKVEEVQHLTDDADVSTEADEQNDPTVEALVDVNKMFKIVAGVLNGTVHPASPTITLLTASEALAIAVEKGLVPYQGLEVLKLLVQFRDESSISSSISTRLLTALGVELIDKSEAQETDVDTEAAPSSDEFEGPPAVDNWDKVAKPLFKLVSGTLNKGLTTQQQTEHADTIRDCLRKPKILSFEQHCDLLADAIGSGAVPDRACQVLSGLSVAMLQHGLGEQAKLVNVLKLDLAEAKLKNQIQERASYLIAILEGKVEGTPDEILEAAETVASAIKAKTLPRATLDKFLELVSLLPHVDLNGSKLERSLQDFLCPRCKVNQPSAQKCLKCRGGLTKCTACEGTGKYCQPCRSCNGTGKGITKRYCPSCNGRGNKVVGECRACAGKGTQACWACCRSPEHGQSRPYCESCQRTLREASKASEAGRGPPRRQQDREPAEGFTITACGKGQLALLQELWTARQATGSVTAAWKIDHPVRSDRFAKRRTELSGLLRREPDSLKGFHGTHPDNILSICENGFDRSKRGSAVGQIYGSGEYLAKNPNVSVGYCRGGDYMLVCRLSLGVTSSNERNTDGDHIWVPHCQYYVISSPDQIMPEYIVKFDNGGHGGHTTNAELERVLSSGKYSTMKQQAIIPVPAPRPCLMSRDSARVLWMGMLHAHIEDDVLKRDITAFLQKYAAQYTEDMRVQIVKGFFKKAHVILKDDCTMPRSVVHRLNKETLMEAGKARLICVEDAHGCPEAKCPKWIAGFCRGQNLRFTHPCWCTHMARPTENARYRLTPVELDGAKGNEILTNFQASAPFHSGNPRVIAINAIDNPTLTRLHGEYRDYLRTKHMEEPAVQELYHGTNNNIL